MTVRFGSVVKILCVGFEAVQVITKCLIEAIFYENPNSANLAPIWVWQPAKDRPESI